MSGGPCLIVLMLYILLLLNLVLPSTTKPENLCSHQITYLSMLITDLIIAYYYNLWLYLSTAHTGLLLICGSYCFKLLTVITSDYCGLFLLLSLVNVVVLVDVLIKHSDYVDAAVFKWP